MDDQPRTGNVSVSVGRDNKGTINVASVINQLGTAGLSVEPDMEVNQAKLQLFHVLVDTFDLEEFRTLCFEMGVNYDALPGEGLMGKERELVQFLARKDRLPELERQLRQLRPAAFD